MTWIASILVEIFLGYARIGVILVCCILNLSASASLSLVGGQLVYEVEFWQFKKWSKEVGLKKTPIVNPLEALFLFGAHLGGHVGGM